MFAVNNQISGRQAARLLLFDMLGYSALLIPAELARTVGHSGIFAIVLGAAAGFLYLRLLRKIICRIRGSYSECLINCFGRIGGNFLKAGYVVYFLFLAGRVAAILGELVVKELLEKQFRFILLILMVLVYYGVSGGIEGRARIYEILFWILVIPLFIMMLFALPSVDTDYWLPVMMENPLTILLGGYRVFLCIAVLFLVPFVSEYMADREQVYHSAKRALLWTVGILGVLYLILLGLFGKNALGTLDYPVVTMMSRIQMTGGFLKRTDTFMFGIWFFTLYALVNSMVFFAERMWVVKKEKRKIWLSAELVIVYLLANSFYYSEEFKMFYEKFFYYVGTPFVVLVPALLCILLGGCASTELENREFPTILTVASESDFTGEWLDGLQRGSKKMDYNHLKVILVERGFLEEKESMAEMLEILKDDKNVPLNAYVVTTEKLHELKEVEKELDKPLGDYLEALLEHADTVKKETYPTIGMLYQEAENQMETLFIPGIDVVEKKPEITFYEVYKRGIAAGQVSSDTALLSFFVGNQIKEYVLQLDEKHYVRLSNARNEIDFREVREKSGLLRKQVKAEVECDGKMLMNVSDSKRESMEEWLEAQIKEYMIVKSAKALENGIDITNSFKKLGKEREWYLYYMQFPDFYEKEIEIVFDIDVDWID